MPTAQLDRLRFFADTPDLSGFQFPEAIPADDETVSEQPPTTRLLLATAGKYKHPRYGRFALNAKVFDSMVANFRASIPTPELSFDFDHEPDFGGSSEACGWITSVETDGRNLYATVKWLWTGAFAIREQKYKYISPTWKLAYVDNQGESRGPTLLGCALTNRPWFEGQAAVSLSHLFARDELALCEEVEEEPTPEPSDSPARMADLADIAQVFGLDSEATEDQVLTAARESAERAEKAPAEGQVLIAQADLDALQGKASKAETEADTLSRRVDELEKANADQAFATIFDQGKHDLKFGDAERDALRTIFDAQGPETFGDYVKNRQPAVPGSAKGSGNAGADEGDAPAGVDTEAFRLDQAVQTYRKAHPDVDYPTALEAVRAEAV